MPDNELKTLVYMREKVIQKGRVAFGHRLSAVDRGDAEVSDADRHILEYWYERFGNMESDVDEHIREAAAQHTIIEHAEKVKGVGLLTAAKIVSQVDIHRAKTVSALWRYAGYGVVDGKRERLKRGEKAHFNRTLKTACYLLGTQFLKANSPYRSIYDEARTYYEENRPEWTKSHQHLAAMRKMIKVFLSHLWMRWRELEGLPTGDPYIIATDPKHTHQYQPEDFGWPPLDAEEA